MIPKECEKCIHCRVCAYNKPKRKWHCDFYEEERPQGEWIDEGQYAENYGEHAYRCKECGYHIITHPNMLFENRYCKNCGADMRKGGAKE